MRIGELERLSGLSRHALRFYERERLIAPARRTASGYREYDAGHLEQLAFIAEARRLGFRLREIGALSRQRIAADGGTRALVEGLGRRRAEAIAEIARLEAQVAAIDAWIQRFGAGTS